MNTNELIFQAFKLYERLYHAYTIPGTSIFRTARAQAITYKALDRYGRRLRTFRRS
jgi:hypothetical protein